MLYNFSEEFKRPKEIESTLKDLDLGVNRLILDLPSLLHTSNTSFKVRINYLKQKLEILQVYLIFLCRAV